MIVIDHINIVDHSGLNDKAVSGFTRLITGLLFFFYFEVGYRWSASGNNAVDFVAANSSWDNAIPLLPIMIVPYMLGYFFILLPLLLLSRCQNFYWGSLIFFGGLSAALLIFKLFPIYMEKSYALDTDFWSRLTLFQQQTDTSFNNCPSLHVAMNIYGWMLLHKIYGKPVIVFLPIPILIVLSTLLVKQHLLMDVAGGILLGVGMGLLFQWRILCTRFSAFLFRAMLIFLLGFLLMNTEQLARVLQLLKSYALQASWLGTILVLFLLGAALLLTATTKKISHRHVVRAKH